MNEDSLNHVFAALADPTRRGLLAHLAQGETNVRSLTQLYRISQPAISKHLNILERAGLVTRTRKGRERIVRVDPRPLDDISTWIGHYAQFWQQQFDEVERYLEFKKNESKGDSDEH